MSALKVIAPRGASSIQDLGRPGYGRYGVSEAGAMDRLALRLANHLVGNHEGEACIEFAMVGGRYEAVEGSCRIAVTGADCEVTINGKALGACRSIVIRAGDTLAIGPARSGVYGYLAVAGGFDTPSVLGSRSVHLRSGIGGGPLTAGTLLRPRLASPPDDVDRGLDRPPWPGSDDPIRVILGPQDDCFTPRGKADFLEAEYRVSPQSDRMGYRLEGRTIEHAGGFNIVSDGIVSGSIQVPGTGQPIVLLADRQSTGGYPKIATVISADIRRLVQRRPGEAVRFAAVSLVEAQAILQHEAAAFAALRDACRPVPPGELFGSERLLGLNLVDGFIRGEV